MDLLGKRFYKPLSKVRRYKANVRQKLSNRCTWGSIPSVVSNKSLYPKHCPINLRNEPIFIDIFKEGSASSSRYYPFISPSHILPESIDKYYIPIAQYRLKNRLLLFDYVSSSPFIPCNELRADRVRREVIQDTLNVHSATYYSNLYTRLCCAFIREYRLRWLFRSLFLRWRLRKIDTSYEPTDDPVLLAPPRKKITIYDHKLVRKFVFDARSLNNSIYANMTIQMYSFPEPQAPRNTYTNLPFTHAQLISIYKQLLLHGEMSWVLSTFHHVKFTFERWKSYADSFLVMNAIRSELVDVHSHTGQDMLFDFICVSANNLNIVLNGSLKAMYRNAVRAAFNCDIIIAFRALAIRYYEAMHFNLTTVSLIISGCRPLFARSNSLVLYMQDMNIHY